MEEEYTGIILNYRIGPRNQYPNQCLIKVLNTSKEEAKTLVGWQTCWPENNPRIKGKIIKPHGDKGVLRVRFRKGLPGQAILTPIKIIK